MQCAILVRATFHCHMIDGRRSFRDYSDVREHAAELGWTPVEVHGDSAGMVDATFERVFASMDDADDAYRGMIRDPGPMGCVHRWSAQRMSNAEWAARSA